VDYWYYISYGAYAELLYTDPTTGEERIARYAHLGDFVQGVEKPVGIDVHEPRMGVTDFKNNHSAGSYEYENKLVKSVSVKKGDLIGYTGNTGNSISWKDSSGEEGGFHLHFAIQKVNSNGTKSALATKDSFYNPWFNITIG